MSLLQNSNAIPVTASADFYDHQIANSVDYTEEELIQVVN